MRIILEAFFRALDKRSYALKENPELVFPQTYNQLQWLGKEERSLEEKLEIERKRFQKPWLRVLTRPAESSALIRVFSGHAGRVTSCAFSPDGQRFSSACDDKTLRVWDADRGSEIRTLEGHLDGVTACAFSPDGEKLASASHDRTLKLWDLGTGRTLHVLKGDTDEVECCAFSPNGRKIVVGDHSGQLLFLGVENLEKA